MNEKTSRRAFLVKPLQYVTAAGLVERDLAITTRAIARGTPGRRS